MSGLVDKKDENTADVSVSELSVSDYKYTETPEQQAATETPEQRLDWLRARGVEIETVEERKAAALQRSSMIKKNYKDEYFHPRDYEGVEGGVVHFVCIPHDTSKPIRACAMPRAQTGGAQGQLGSLPRAGDQLPLYVKPYFSDGKCVDPSLLLQQTSRHFATGDSKMMSEKNITASAVDAVAAEGSVETFTVVHPDLSNSYNGVYIYLDEVGMLKNLPLNVRAGSLCENCGFSPPPKFFGDVFVGRYCTRPSPGSNSDFLLGADTDGGSEWQRRAVSENLSWHQALKDATGRQGVTQPANDGEDGVAKIENGGLYKWTQKGDEVELVFALAEGAEANKNKIKVAFMPQSVSIKYDGAERLKLRLYEKVDVDGCTWTKDKGDVVVTMEKLDTNKSWPRISEAA